MMKTNGAKKIFTVGTLTYTTSGVIALFCWMLWGDFAWIMKGRSVGALAAVMVKKFGISNYLYGLLIVSIPNFTNIFLIPWISYKSDRHRGRFGRRIPYLFMTTPIVTIALIGLGLSPWLGTLLKAQAIFAKFDVNTLRLCVFAFFWLLLDLGTTLSVNIFSALINDVVPKILLGRFFAMTRAVSLLAAVLFNAKLLGKAEDYGPELLIGIGILYGIGLSTLCLMVKEGEYPPPPEEETGKQNPISNTIKMVKSYWQLCFTLPYYRVLFLGMTLVGLGTLPFNTYYIFFAKSMDVSMDALGKCQATCFAVSFVLCFFLGALSDKFHPLRTSMVALAICVLVDLCGGIFCTSVNSFLVIQLIHGIAVMSFNTLFASCAARLFPQLYFAQFNSIAALLSSASTMLLVPLLGKLLDLSGQRYVLVYIIGAVIQFCGLVALFFVYRGFLRYGGDEAYQAPLPDGVASHESQTTPA
ncbi:MAG: SLC45 family MFS transporter [Lentisphaerae bacterium]|nr:SLC45 family MFS transporter [Lentisphaerota bacterium]